MVFRAFFPSFPSSSLYDNYFHGLILRLAAKLLWKAWFCSSLEALQRENRSAELQLRVYWQRKKAHLPRALETHRSPGESFPGRNYKADLLPVTLKNVERSRIKTIVWVKGNSASLSLFPSLVLRRHGWYPLPAAGCGESIPWFRFPVLSSRGAKQWILKPVCGNRKAPRDLATKRTSQRDKSCSSIDSSEHKFTWISGNKSI